MAGRLYMLDTNICSFIMRARPPAVLSRLTRSVESGDLITISAITYGELRFGATSSKASSKHLTLVEAFVERLDGILPWDAGAVEKTAEIRVALAGKGTPIGENDAAIAGNALAVGAVLVTNNTREFRRVDALVVEDWTEGGE